MALGFVQEIVKRFSLDRCCIPDLRDRDRSPPLTQLRPNRFLHVFPTRPLRLVPCQIKIPLVAFYGAFGLIPYRRKMKMVIGRCV